jgi:hypothetical protein
MKFYNRTDEITLLTNQYTAIFRPIGTGTGLKHT